jgi:sugar/nucleoside kinase (ribokinase family)
MKTASMIKASEEELELIRLSMQVEPGDLLLRFNVDELVVTRGASGGIIWSNTETPVEYNSPNVDMDINPTGAGDVFFAAYAANRLFKGQSILSAAEKAADLAADQVSGNFIDATLSPDKLG